MTEETYKQWTDQDIQNTKRYFKKVIFYISVIANAFLIYFIFTQAYVSAFILWLLFFPDWQDTARLITRSVK